MWKSSYRNLNWSMDHNYTMMSLSNSRTDLNPTRNSDPRFCFMFYLSCIASSPLLFTSFCHHFFVSVFHRFVSVSLSLSMFHFLIWSSPFFLFVCRHFLVRFSWSSLHCCHTFFVVQLTLYRYHLLFVAISSLTFLHCHFSLCCDSFL